LGGDDPDKAHHSEKAIMGRTKTWVLGAVGVGLLVAAAWTAGWAGMSRRPALDAPAVVELGEHEDGSIATFQFTLRNAGNAELLLSDFRTDCASCNALETEVGGRFYLLRELRLASGESAQVRLRKSVRGAAGQPIHSVILFRTNVPDLPEAVVRVTVANVLAGLTASPSQWPFGTIPQGQIARHEFTLSDSATPPRPVERVQSSDPARVRAKLTPGGKLVVEVNTARPGPVNASVRLYVRGGKADPDPILVTGRVVAPVECSPAVVRLPACK
jgi:hypothetical protein